MIREGCTERVDRTARGNTSIGCRVPNKMVYHLALDTKFKHSGPSCVVEHLVATRRSDSTEGLNQAQLQQGR